MRVVGIDPSLSCTGVAVFSPSGRAALVDLRSVKSTAKKHGGPMERQRFLVGGILEVLRRGDVLVMEDFAVGSRFQASGSFVERVELCGIIKYVARAVTGMPALTVQPQHLKMFATGNGGSDKDAVKAAVKAWGLTPANFDEADAAAMAKLVWTLLCAPDQATWEPQRKAHAKFVETGENMKSLHQVCAVQSIALPSALTCAKMKPGE